MFQASIRAIAESTKGTTKTPHPVATTDRADEAINAAILSTLAPQKQ